MGFLSQVAAMGTAFGVVFLAELGDKTQLALVALAGRGQRKRLLAGALCAFALATILAVTVGAVLANYLQRRPLDIIAGVVFLGVGVWHLLHHGSSDGTTRSQAGFAAGFITMLLGELGDKTEVATALLAATGGAVTVGIGAFLALSTSAVLAVFIGGQLGRRLRPDVLRWVSSALFLGVGAWLLASGLLG